MRIDGYKNGESGAQKKPVNPHPDGPCDDPACPVHGDLKSIIAGMLGSAPPSLGPPPMIMVDVVVLRALVQRREDALNDAIESRRSLLKYRVAVATAAVVSTAIFVGTVAAKLLS